MRVSPQLVASPTSLARKTSLKRGDDNDGLQNGDLLKSPELLQHVTRQDVDRLRQSMGLTNVPSASNGLVLYKISYRTSDVHGAATNASGLLAIPDAESGSYPLVSYQHGTTLQHQDVPSKPNIEGSAAALAFGGDGHIVCAPDYLGQGESTSFHPYHHAASEATAAVDLLRATRKILENGPSKWNSQLFLTGYSQGGHATAALQRSLESDPAHEFSVTASAPMAGAYDLSGVQFATPPSALSSALKPYALMAMNNVYGFAPSTDDIFRPEVRTQIHQLFDGTHGLHEVVGALTQSDGEIFQPAFTNEALLADENHPYRNALRANDVYDWKPNAPTRFIHAKSDNVVAYANSEKAYNRMKELGAPVELVNLGDHFDHGGAFIPALSQAASWFATFTPR